LHANNWLASRVPLPLSCGVARVGGPFYLRGSDCGRVNKRSALDLHLRSLGSANILEYHTCPGDVPYAKLAGLFIDSKLANLATLYGRNASRIFYDFSETR
jgi:hypothetical protein